MKTALTVVLVAVLINVSSCTIEGLKFLEALIQKNNSATEFPRGEDPCHPLYWYPRHVPEYCQYKTTPKNLCGEDPCPTPGPSVMIPVPPAPMPMPYPVPQPAPNPAPAPMPMQPALMPQFPPAPPQPLPFPVPFSYMPHVRPSPPLLPPLPYGIPLAPTNPMVPVGGVPYPYIPPPYPGYPGGIRQLGMVPGVPGMVSPDGGINILPFSDAYSDMLQNHRQEVINKQLQKLVAKYDHKYSSGRAHRTHRKYSRRRNHYHR